jgi:hypothetical protein
MERGEMSFSKSRRPKFLVTLNLFLNENTKKAFFNEKYQKRDCQKLGMLGGGDPEDPIIEHISNAKR